MAPQYLFLIKIPCLLIRILFIDLLSVIYMHRMTDFLDAASQKLIYLKSRFVIWITHYQNQDILVFKPPAAIFAPVIKELIKCYDYE